MPGICSTFVVRFGLAAIPAQFYVKFQLPVLIFWLQASLSQKCVTGVELMPLRASVASSFSRVSVGRDLEH